MYDSISVLI